MDELRGDRLVDGVVLDNLTGDNSDDDEQRKNINALPGEILEVLVTS